MNEKSLLTCGSHVQKLDCACNTGIVFDASRALIKFLQYYNAENRSDNHDLMIRYMIYRPINTSGSYCMPENTRPSTSLAKQVNHFHQVYTFIVKAQDNKNAVF